jgi:hypothetical protein
MWVRFVRANCRLWFVTSTDAPVEIMVCISLYIGGGTDDYINAAGPASGEIRPIKPFFLRFY